LPPDVEHDGNTSEQRKDKHMAKNTLSDLESLLVDLGLGADEREQVLEMVRSLDLTNVRGISTEDEESLEDNPVNHLTQKAIRLNGALDRMTDVEKAVLMGATRAWLADGLKE
jgi:2-methylisocitrate lyase-like PEP mutase family enzyme